jgi:ParB/RepB/Spo0J family partition protein
MYVEKGMTMAKIARVVPCQFNPRKRFDPVGLAELTESVRKLGVLQPILVRTFRFPEDVTKDGAVDQYEIICGERRFRAATEAGLKEIPARIVDMDDKTALEVQIVENLQRSDLHPLEEAEGYELLMKQYGYEGADQIADEIGKSASYVYGRMKLCALVEPLRKKFYEGKIEASTALLLARIPEKLQEKAAKDIGVDAESAYTEMTYRRAKEYLRENYTLKLSSAPFDPKDGALLADAGPCADCPKRTGNQKELFADVGSVDVCTDPACFAKKSEASFKATKEMAELSGHKFMPKGQAKGMLAPDGELIDWRGGDAYVKLNDKCEEDPKKRKYSQLLKDLPPSDIIVAVDSKGRAHKLIDRHTAKTALDKAGHAFAEDLEVKKERRALTPEERQIEKDKQSLIAMGEEIAEAKVVQAVVDKAEAEGVDILVSPVVMAMLSSTNGYALHRLEERRGWKEIETDKKFAGAKPAQRAGIIMESLLLFVFDNTFRGDRRRTAIYKKLGIDVTKICRDAASEAKQKIDKSKAAAVKDAQPAQEKAVTKKSGNGKKVKK